ncbi:MAG: FkbM family methyltransferase [Dorea sp.]|nr:FkbM family methyltransferase [Dorea sp.]
MNYFNRIYWIEYDKRHFPSPLPHVEIDSSPQHVILDSNPHAYPTPEEFQAVKWQCLHQFNSHIQSVSGLFQDKKSQKILENFLLMRCFQNDLIRFNLATEIAENTTHSIGQIAFYIKGFPVWRLVDEHQYYPADIIHLSDHEVFLDGGAWVGDTIHQFLQETNNKYDGIYAFEASPNNYQECLKGIAAINHEKKIQVLNYGLGKEGQSLYFPKEGLCGDPLMEIPSEALKDYTKVEIVDIKQVLTKEQLYSITFVKLDIEGSELAALKNMEDFIREKRPKLAICVYHKLEDIFEIPLYIKSLFEPEDGYEMYLRHHENGIYETVLYCIPIPRHNQDRLES